MKKLVLSIILLASVPAITSAKPNQSEGPYTTHRFSYAEIMKIVDGRGCESISKIDKEISMPYESRWQIQADERGTNVYQETIEDAIIHSFCMRHMSYKSHYDKIEVFEFTEN